ncbi:MAG: TIM barrel protein [Oscillochloris sp.]|nr:TIM barrel protein [Oscillochloris sp.]
MPRFAANLSLLFTEAPLIERFERAAAASFTRVEIQFPYELAPKAFAAALARNKQELVLFNLPAGDWAAGDRGIAAHPERVDAFRAGVQQAIGLAREVGCPRLNLLAGLRDPRLPLDAQRRTLRDNIRYAAEALAQHHLTLVIEALNQYDLPGFLLSSSHESLGLIAAVGRPNVRLQYDVYHMQRGEGELAGTIARNLDRIGHIQIADNPGRHEPGSGEINFRFLLPYLDTIGYDGIVSLEYIPAGDTLAGLGWLEEHGLTL